MHAPAGPPPNVIRSLRLVGDWPDTLAARQHAEALLQQVSFAVSGLPPTALLVVDRIQDRQLGRILQMHAHARQASAAREGWARAFQASLSALASHAGRPLREAVPSGTPAVVFYDLGELLACLALDLLSGETAVKWWWQALFAARDYQAELVAALHRSPQVIPPFMEHLAARGKSAEFTRQLGEPACQDLSVALAKAYQVGGLAGETAHLPEALPDRQDQAAGPEELPTARPPAPASGQFTAAPIFRSRTGWIVEIENRLLAAVPEAQDIGLSEAGRTLLLIALGLRRAPTMVRGLSARAQQAKTSSQDQASAVQSPTEPPETHLAAEDQASQETQAGPQTMDNPRSAEEQGMPVSLETVHTRFGGMFYLLNLAVYLGIYNDFTQPANPGWTLSPWDLLCLLGFHWFGEGVSADPIWRLLCSLAGRSGEAADIVRAIQAEFTPEPGWENRLALPPGKPGLARTGTDWLPDLAALMQDRLALAFGHNHPLEFLTQPAAIQVTPLRLDIHFNLASHPIEIRLAGLDRDPGWLPAAGMYIYYHYDL